MKIVSRGKVINSRKFFEKKQRRNRIRVFLVLFLLFLLFFLIIYSLRLEKFRITGVEIEGENVVEEDEMRKLAEEKIRGSYLWLVPRSNALVYPHSTIESSLLQDFPRLKSVNLELDENHRLLIGVEERLPSALYCDKIPNSDDTSSCFFVDEDGLIFAKAPSFSSGVYFIYINDTMAEEPVGQTILSPEAFADLKSFMKNIDALNIHPAMLEIGSDNYTFILPSGGRIIWRKDSDPNVIVRDLVAFLANESIKSENNFIERIIYLDLSISNKAHWKLRD